APRNPRPHRRRRALPRPPLDRPPRRAVLAEQNDEWQVARRYMSAESITTALADPVDETEEVMRLLDVGVPNTERSLPLAVKETTRRDPRDLVREDRRRRGHRVPGARGRARGPRLGYAVLQHPRGC